MGSTHPTLFMVCQELNNRVDVIHLECRSPGFKPNYYTDVFSTAIESNSLKVSALACCIHVLLF